MTEAATNWNTVCTTDGRPGHRDAPILSPSDQTYNIPPMEGRAIVPVRFDPSQHDDPDKCKKLDGTEGLCYPVAVATPTDKGWEVTVFGRFGLAGSDGVGVRQISELLPGGLTEVFMHEMGHVMNLHHDVCPNSSIMHDTIEKVMAGSNRLPSPTHCERLEEMFDPPEPTDDVSEVDDDKKCTTLVAYCDNRTLWPVERSTCLWSKEVYTAFYFQKETTIRSLDLNCFDDFWAFGESPPFPWPFQRYRSPALALTPVEVLSGGRLQVSGWVWGRTDDFRQLAFWIDGEVPEVIGVQHGRPDPGPCEAGFDPQFCSPNSGFLATFDISRLAAGRHLLQMIATDLNPYPMPTAFEVPFYVNASAPNQPPVALADSYFFSVQMGYPAPVVLDVLSNDYDPDGGPVELSRSPILTPPTHGTVERLNDHQLVYTPFPHTAGEDTFTYQILDNFGIPGSAQVTMTVVEVIILP